MPERIEPSFIATYFPTLAEMTYLNNASTGIPPATTIQAMKDHLDGIAHAAVDFERILETLRTARSLLSRVLGGAETQYGLVPSTSEGINVFAHGIGYPKGSNIVLCDLEFPANYVPWQNAARIYGAELRVVKSRNGAATIDSYKEKIDDNTKVVAVSQVQFATGFRTQLKELAHIVHEAGGYLFTDIIQAAGCVNTDLVKEEVDFAAAQAAKWLLGPVGAGFVYIKKSIIDEIKPRFLGWWGVKNMEDFAYSDREPLPDASKFEVGSAAVIAYVGLIESLKVLLKLPANSREKVAFDNAGYLRKRLSESGIDYYDFGPKNNSAIVSCAPADVEKLETKLLKEKIHCSIRNGRLRVSPHFYNMQAEIDKLVEHLR
jgi:selenocysteine lyase/cysteine desulfurase